MPDAGPTSERLEALRERWQADKGSRVFLQLADEYRRLGQPEEAARVLEQGLEGNPGHVGAQVALGRCRLELGRPDEAVALLEGAIESDPTQMVAYRLLVDAYLDQGRAEDARQRLRIYSLLNDSDPEIAELRLRIGELDRRRGEDTVGSGSPGADRPAAAAAAIAAPDGEPFPALAEPAAGRRYLAALSAEGLFDLGPAPAVEPAVAPERPPGALFDLEPEGAAPAPDLSALLEPPPAPVEGRATVTLGRLYLRQGHRGEAEEIFREVLAREPENAEARRHLDELEARREEPPPVRPPLAASELLAGFAGGAGGGGPLERKRQVLERYLDRIRGGAERDVH
jgi:tetratricopeptide (TPR) repeat protein